MGFLTRLRTDCYAPDGSIRDGEFVVVSPLVYRRANNSVITVPGDFVTDFASIPRLARLVPGFDVNGRSRAAAVLHDFLYSSHGVVVLRFDSDPAMSMAAAFSRGECDAIFHEALIALGCSAAVAATMFAGVRAGGWLYWNRRKEGIKPAYDFVSTGHQYTLQELTQ